MQVLRVFKTLHRTRMAVFKDDEVGLKGEIFDVWYYLPETNIFLATCLMNGVYQSTLTKQKITEFTILLHKAARLKINEEFRNNRNETSEENIKKVQ